MKKSTLVLAGILILSLSSSSFAAKRHVLLGVLGGVVAGVVGSNLYHSSQNQKRQYSSNESGVCLKRMKYYRDDDGRMQETGKYIRVCQN